MGSRHIASALAHKRRRDTHVLFAVHYEDGGRGYVRIPPDLANTDSTQAIREVCREAQSRGELRQGKIVSVVPVH
jgi:hypothetical protein